jgi:flagellar M-ring protein FliF
MADDTSNTKTAPLKWLGRMNPQQLLVAMLAIAATVAIIAGLWMWGQSSDYRVLYSNLSDQDGGAIIEALQRQNIPYKFAEGGGALLVPAGQVHEIRLRLASQGLPKGGSVGFELMENQKFGTSQFLEQVNYQRSLEGELARSMQTLDAVKSARVHLAIPKPTVFVKEQQKPSASVVLTLYAGRVLDQGQTNAIIHLVASSIPGMMANNVTVLDQNGTLLSAAHEQGPDGMDATQLKYARQVEADFVKRIEDIVSPITGANNVRAQVTADIDFSRVEQTSESYKPNQPPNQPSVRSTQLVESNNESTGPSGIPGALSNQPPLAAAAPIVTNPPPAPAAPQGAPGSPPAGSPPAGTTSTTTSAAKTALTSSSRKESTTNYELDRLISHTNLPTGLVKRLSIAVVINNHQVKDKSGKVTSVPLSENENAQIATLVKNAVGFNADRGDTITVLNSVFNAETPETAPELPLWKQPDIIAMAKDGLKYLLIAGMILFLMFGILRPALKSITASSTSKANVEPSVARATPTMAPPPSNPVSPAAASYESNLQMAKSMVQQDPKIVASVVKDWVVGNE